MLCCHRRAKAQLTIHQQADVNHYNDKHFLMLTDYEPTHNLAHAVAASLISEFKLVIFEQGPSQLRYSLILSQASAANALDSS